MEDNSKLIESLLEKTAEYGKTGFELVKLHVVDKTSDKISSIMSHSFLVAILSCFLLFVNLGVAWWLGEIMGRIYYGFFAVAAFYAIVAFVLHFFMHKWLKRIFYDYFIRQMLK